MVQLKLEMLCRGECGVLVSYLAFTSRVLTLPYEIECAP